MSIIELEQRVETLEQTVEKLVNKMDYSKPAELNAWIDQIHGTFQNDAAYRQAARLGRQWRKKQRGPGVPRPLKAPRK
jgi:hypothetical protein